jgi:pimeloyl-ACP methyl ester carboxylesterase
MKRLIVCVPGLDGSTTSWNPLLERLCEEDSLKGAAVMRFNHDCRWYSTDFAKVMSNNLLAQVNAEWEDQKDRGEEYDDVCFMAHSIGALLVRRAYLLALGDDAHGRDGQAWAKKVSRIVLFAGINRGLCSSVNEEQGKVPYKFRRWLLRRVIELLSALPTHFLLEDVLAGSDLVTNIRLSWIRAFRNLENAPTVVQVLGTEDKIVTTEDSIDLEQFPTGRRIDLPHANHATVVTVETDDGFDRRRYALIRKALLGTFERSPCRALRKEPSDTVVFVVHGIRSSNTTWVQQATRLLQSSLPSARVVPATYWYFSALQFLLPLVRKRRTRWFKETYTYYLSRNPAANFHFIGHSNGTYLLGYSLRNLPDMRFSRVILAGSVLPRDFPWRGMLGTQVQEVWNHRSQKDFPVAILCAALRGVFMNDVGTGGYDGFEAIPEIHEFSYYPGGHDAPLNDRYLPSLIKEITGELSSSLTEPLANQLEWFSRLSRLSVALPYLVLLVVVLVTYFLGPLVASRAPHLTVFWGCALICGALLFAIGLTLNYL